jgi:hypothetical protein
MKFDTLTHAKNEVQLAKGLLESSPDDIIQQERITYWLSYLGLFEEAEKYAFSPKAKANIEKFRDRQG